MEIVVLDAYSIKPDEISWDIFNDVGNITVYTRTAPCDVVSRIGTAEAILTNKVIISDEIMAQCPNLKYVGVLATGYNIVDVEAAKNRGIIVTNIPAYSTMSVAQKVFAHLLNVTNSVAGYARDVRDGAWVASPDFCFLTTPIMEISGKTLGIVGLGNIGMAVAKIALAFGMKVIAITSKTAQQLPDGILPVNAEELYRKSDVISLNCPLTDSTKELINHNTIAMMKSSAVVINTGRGQLVNERDVADALNSGKIAAYCADVLSEEPPQSDNPLLSAQNCHLTPHIAWASHEARMRLIKIAFENVRQFASAETIINRVN